MTHGAQTTEREPVLAVHRVHKEYGAIRALEDVHLSLNAGEVLGLVGDNGAGKSTLAGILSGAISPSEGELFVEGTRRVFRSPHDARDLGIEVVFQDLALAPDLTVAENIFLGREISTQGGRWLGWLNRRAMERRSKEELQLLSIRIQSVKTPCRALSGGQRQAIAIARAVLWSSKVLILDEPTAALGVEQQAQVARLITDVASRGVGIILISHNMPQVLELCDRVVVLYRGRIATTLYRGDYDIEQVVKWITGAALAEHS